ncbi:MAG: hypothetical protein ACLP1Y_16590 [Candidatus Acidiferrales bacterium]
MNVLRIGAMVFAMFALLFAQSPPAASPQTGEAVSISDPEEYAVYTALLSAEYPTKPPETLVIDDWTPSSEKGPFVGFVAGLAPSGAGRPDVQAETAADFEAKQRESFRLERKFSPKLSYVLVSESDLRDVFHHDANGKISSQPWQEFYEKYPEAQGIMSLSRVGFNKAKDEALVYLIRQWNLLGGSAFYYVLARRGGAWKVKSKILVWLSRGPSPLMLDSGRFPGSGRGNFN